MNETFDYAILGAGLAGLSLADALSSAGLSVIVLDTSSPGAGASGTPGALVNLATGRRGTRVWRAESCYRALLGSLKKAATHASAPFHVHRGVLRPALSEKMAAKMWEQYRKTDWNPSRCRWLDRAEIQRRHPGIGCVGGGLWLPAGMAVEGGAYLAALAAGLRGERVRIVEGAEYELSPGDGRWRIRNGNETLGCRRIVFATGYAMTSHPLWDFLPLKSVKGQVAQFECDRDLDFHHSVSSLGYIARLGHPRRFVMGSTYEHDFKHRDPDEQGEAYLRKRLRRTLPKLESRSRLVKGWAGVRVTTPDRKPVLGAHPHREGLYCYTALGSKGMLYSRYLAECLAARVEKGEPLPQAVDIRRFIN